tara:strand:- start:175 stop:957 length:783 start_codon:yes stop_codon:yes gene_type:complete
LGNSLTVTADSGLAYNAGSRIRLTSNNNDLCFLEGLVSYYTPLNTDITFTIDYVAGSCSDNSWNINVAGQVGATGPAGPTGPDGAALNTNYDTQLLYNNNGSISYTVAAYDDSNQYIGIGHKSPDTLFDVSGDSKFRGNVTITGDLYITGSGKLNVDNVELTQHNSTESGIMVIDPDQVNSPVKYFIPKMEHEQFQGDSTTSTFHLSTECKGPEWLFIHDDYMGTQRSPVEYTIVNKTGIVFSDPSNYPYGQISVRHLIL